MMLFSLSIKNMKKSIKDYGIYFFTLVIGVAIFYVFKALFCFFYHFSSYLALNRI